MSTMLIFLLCKCLPSVRILFEEIQLIDFYKLENRKGWKKSIFIKESLCQLKGHAAHTEGIQHRF